MGCRDLAESEQRVKSVRVMGSPLHQAWWKAVGCCRGKWLPETLPSITRQVRPPNPAIRMEERRGGWGWRIRLEGTKRRLRLVREQTINNLFLSLTVLCLSLPLLICFCVSFSISIFWSSKVQLCSHSGTAPAGQSPLLHSIASLIIMKAASKEENLRRGRGIER